MPSDHNLIRAHSGGIAVQAYASAVLVESTIADCAAECGGGLWADRANVTLRGGSRIERCTTGGDGGGILAYDNSKVALLEGSVLSSCHAGPAAFGGGLHLADSQCSITQSSIINCSAGYCGGAFGVFAGLWADLMASSSLLATNSVRMLQLKQLVVA